ncbi:MAG: glycosyltransferase family 4 protein [Chloroflexota bacterium]
MKVLQVVHQFPPRHVGGTEIYVRGLSKALRKRGHDVTVFFGDNVPGEQPSDDLKLVAVKGGLNSSSSGLRTFLSAFGNNGAEKAFYKLLQLEAPDIVHFHHLAGLSAKLVQIANRARIPTLFTLHDYWFLCPNSQLVTPKRKVCQGPSLNPGCATCAAERLGHPYLAWPLKLARPLFLLRNRMVWEALKAADLVVAPSLFIRDMFIRHRFPPERIVHLPLGIEVPHTNVFPVSNGKRYVKLRVAYIGSLAWQKGVHVLIQTFNAIDPSLAQLRVYGDESVFPEYSQALRRSARSEGIHFMGSLSRDNLRNVLMETDVLAVPSLWYENFPLVVQEAFAARVPVIASRIGALPEQVRDGIDGLLFEPDDARDLLRKIGRLIENPARVKVLSGNIPAVETMPHHASVMEQLYQQPQMGMRSAKDRS